MTHNHPRIRATHQTYLKKRPVQANELADDQKILVDVGREYPVSKVLKSDGSHIFIELAYDSGEWYLYAPHWELDEVDLGEYEEVKKEVVVSPTAQPETIESVNWFDFDDKVSSYFTVGEVFRFETQRITTSPDIQKNILALGRLLDKVRKQWGAPIGVTSWYRDPVTNSQVGGATRSQHLTGNAADIYPIGGDIYEFQRWLDKGLGYHYALGLGAHRKFVHLDLRHHPNRKGIRWDY